MLDVLLALTATATPTDLAVAKHSTVWVRIERAEGLSSECVSREFKGPDAFRHANETLARWARTAPKSGGYNKCDFEVRWDDGETYEGRFDLEWRHVGGGNLLGDHMTSFLRFMTGDHCPAHLTQEKYDAYIQRSHTPEERQATRDYLKARTFE